MPEFQDFRLNKNPKPIIPEESTGGTVRHINIASTNPLGSLSGAPKKKKNRSKKAKSTRASKFENQN